MLASVLISSFVFVLLGVFCLQLKECFSFPSGSVKHMLSKIGRCLEPSNEGDKDSEGKARDPWANRLKCYFYNV